MMKVAKEGNVPVFRRVRGDQLEQVGYATCGASRPQLRSGDAHLTLNHDARTERERRVQQADLLRRLFGSGIGNGVFQHHNRHRKVG